MRPLIQENVELAPLTYYKIGGRARWFAQPESVEQLGEVADYLRKMGKTGLRYFVLGAGSNVLIDDAGFDGLVLSTTRLDRSLAAPDLADDPVIEAGCSVMVIQLLRLCMRAGIGGFERLVGIPGSIGGVIFMNAGTALGEVGATLAEVHAYDLATKTQRIIRPPDLAVGYRHQKFLTADEIVVRGRLKGLSGDPKTVQNSVQALLDSRKRSQPIDKPSCGSVFRNPDPAKGVHAWKVISDVGLRGHRVGQAQISEQHANFIVNLGGARAVDVRALINEAKRRVREQLGLTLVEEVCILAPDGGRPLP